MVAAARQCATPSVASANLDHAAETRDAEAALRVLRDGGQHRSSRNGASLLGRLNEVALTTLIFY
jgi:hypothetical protein